MAPTVKSREVDKIVAISPRPAEMKVLCLGLSRTSTMTMYTALGTLGYRSYHMIEAPKPANKKNRHLNCWLEALQYKVNGVGKAYGPEDFDKILQDYNAVTDMPCVNFAKELVAAFPNAKVVLTQREPEPWIKSMNNTIYDILEWRLWPILRYIDPDGMGTFHDTLQLAVADWTAPAPWHDRRALAEYMPKHTEYIRSLVPPERLLEFHPRDGWEPLCKFLGRDVPENTDFPYVNKGRWARNYVAVGVVLKCIKISFPYVVSAVVLFVAWKWATPRYWT